MNLAAKKFGDERDSSPAASTQVLVTRVAEIAPPRLTIIVRIHASERNRSSNMI